MGIILAFADEIDNQRLDCDMCGFAIEPATMHRPRPDAYQTSWTHQKFMVDRDIAGLVLTLHN